MSVKEMKSKLEVKNEKIRIMKLIRKWSRLIYGITKKDRKAKRSLQLCIKWSSISRKLLKLNPDKASTQARWKLLIVGLDNKYPLEF